MIPSKAFLGIASLTLLGVVVVFTFFYWGERNDRRLLKPDDPALVALGADIYAEQCAACHGASLQGEPNWQRRNADGKLPAPPHDESGHTWHHDEATLFAITKHGTARTANLEGYESDMPIYDGLLTDEEIVAVLSFIKSTWPKEIRDRHDRLTAK